MKLFDKKIKMKLTCYENIWCNNIIVIDVSYNYTVNLYNLENKGKKLTKNSSRGASIYYYRFIPTAKNLIYFYDQRTKSYRKMGN